MRSAFQSKKLLKNLKYCIQRIRLGYCDADLWDIDEWFLSVIVPMLRQFNNTRTGGCPGELIKNFVPEADDETDRDKLYEIGEQKWNEALNQLANDFETLKRLQDEIGDSKQQETIKNECFKRFSEYFFYLWD